VFALKQAETLLLKAERMIRQATTNTQKAASFTLAAWSKLPKAETPMPQAGFGKGAGAM
jgi:hypothetical protein